MESLDYLSKTELLDALPPIEASPILENLAKLGLNRFKDNYAIETPTYENGIVDHVSLMEQVSALVTPEYKWKAPFFDEHHLHWYEHRYSSGFNKNPEVTTRFRDLPTHKIWVPRQIHDFIHVVTIPSEPPEYEIMKSSVDEFRLHAYLYRISTEAINLRERSDRVIVVKGQKQDALIDSLTRRVSTDPETLEERRREFIERIEYSHKRGYIDLSQLAAIDMQEDASIEAMLPIIKEFTNRGLMRQKGRVALRVDVPYERAA